MSHYSNTSKKVVNKSQPNGTQIVTTTKTEYDRNGEIIHYESDSREIPANEGVNIGIDNSGLHVNGQSFHEIQGTSSSLFSYQNSFSELQNLYLEEDVSSSLAMLNFVDSDSDSDSRFKEVAAQSKKSNEKKKEVRGRERTKSRGRSQSDGTQGVSKWAQRERSRSKYRKK